MYHFVLCLSPHVYHHLIFIAHPCLGQIVKVFEDIEPKFGHLYDVTYLSRDPYVITLDNFLTDEEINGLLGSVGKWYDIQSEEYATTFSRFTGPGRTGNISWCFGECEQVMISFFCVR